VRLDGSGTVTRIAKEHPEFHDGGSYFFMSGTSQATAVVSGVVALMLELQPNLTPDEVKCKLMDSARPAVRDDGTLAYSVFQQGAGLVTALVHPDCRANLAAFPEIMVLGWDALADKLPAASVVVVGPGLGDSAHAAQLLDQLRQANQPMVVDASALIAEFLESSQSENLLITPHPGEAAALLSISTAEVQADRLGASARLAERFGATCVLKGSGTLVAGAGRMTAINARGNPGMASAGMGDVLSGIVAALVGQGLAPFEAARSAVLIHALCAEDFSHGQDQVGLIAGDIIERIPRLIGRLRGVE